MKERWYRQREKDGRSVSFFGRWQFLVGERTMQNGGLQRGINRDDKYISLRLWGGWGLAGGWEMDTPVHYPYRPAPGGSLHISDNPPPPTQSSLSLCLQKPILIILHKGLEKLEFAPVHNGLPATRFCLQKKISLNFPTSRLRLLLFQCCFTPRFVYWRFSVRGEAK